MKMLIQILFLLISNTTIAQNYWEELSFPDSTNIRCLTTNDQMHLFVGVANDGISGGVYRSTDTAQTWELVLDAGNFMVQSIDINENGEIFVGRTGFINFMKSSDNGNTWVDLALPSNSNVMKILCYSLDTIYASLWEDNGALLIRSTDNGFSWDSIFATANHSEYISDIVISSTGAIYISLTGFFSSTGGVFKSDDDGTTWGFIGLLNHQVHALSINSIDEVFSGDWYTMGNEYPGIYSLYSGDEEFSLIHDTYNVSDMAINSEDDIFVNDHLGVLRSLDSGLSFEYINEGLTGSMDEMHIDSDDYIYVARSKFLAKSVNQTVSISDQNPTPNHLRIELYPNPTTNSLFVSSNFTYKIQRFVIYNQNTQVVLTGQLINNSIEISSLENGLYIIELETENKTIRKKIIKK